MARSMGDLCFSLTACDGTRDGTDGIPPPPAWSKASLKTRFLAGVRKSEVFDTLQRKLEPEAGNLDPLCAVCWSECERVLSCVTSAVEEEPVRLRRQLSDCNLNAQKQIMAIKARPKPEEFDQVCYFEPLQYLDQLAQDLVCMTVFEHLHLIQQGIVSQTLLSMSAEYFARKNKDIEVHEEKRDWNDERREESITRKDMEAQKTRTEEMKRALRREKCTQTLDYAPPSEARPAHTPHSEDVLTPNQSPSIAIDPESGLVITSVEENGQTASLSRQESSNVVKVGREGVDAPLDELIDDDTPNKVAFQERMNKKSMLEQEASRASPASAEHVFSPDAPAGFTVNPETGQVISIEDDGQAAELLVKRGSKISAVNGRKYSEALLDDCMNGSKPYKLTIEKPADSAGADGPRVAETEQNYQETAGKLRRLGSKAPEAERRAQEERGVESGRCEEAERRAVAAEQRLAEAEHHRRDAERSVAEAEQRCRDAERLVAEAEGRTRDAEGHAAEADRRCREAEQRAQDAETQLQAPQIDAEVASKSLEEDFQRRFAELKQDAARKQNELNSRLDAALESVNSVQEQRAMTPTDWTQRRFTELKEDAARVENSIRPRLNAVSESDTNQHQSDRHNELQERIKDLKASLARLEESERQANARLAGLEARERQALQRANVTDASEQDRCVGRTTHLEDTASQMVSTEEVERQPSAPDAPSIEVEAVISKRHGSVTEGGADEHKQDAPRANNMAFIDASVQTLPMVLEGSARPADVPAQETSQFARPNLDVPSQESESKRTASKRKLSNRSPSHMSAIVPAQVRVHGVQTDLTGALMDRIDAEKAKEIEQLKQLVGELVTKLQAHGDGKAADDIADSLGLQTLMKTSARKVFERLYNDALDRVERLKKLRKQYYSQGQTPTDWSHDVLLEALGHNSETQARNKSDTMWRPNTPTLKKRYLTLVLTEGPKVVAGSIESGWKYVSSQPVVEAVWQDDPRSSWTSANKPWLSRDVWHVDEAPASCEEEAPASPASPCKPPRSPRLPAEPRSVFIPPKIDLNKEPPPRLQKSDSLPALGSWASSPLSSEGSPKGPRGFSRASPSERDAARRKRRSDLNREK
jgi:hypothetical protein